MSIATLPLHDFASRTSHSPPLLTAEEFAELYDGQRVELVNGIVEELPIPKSFLHGVACINAGAAFRAYAKAQDCGVVAGNESWMRTTRSPDSIRGPDVMYVSYTRKSKGTLTNEMIDVSPEVVVEVKSPSDSWPKMLVKANEYLAADVLAVVLINPETRSAMICRSGVSAYKLQATDELALPEILPGFSVNVGSLFE